ncbi:MAG: IS4 family transposase [Planctomycetes bacterium]|nr:IS4 family transposase [Planctomycetota bacterium]
MNDPNETAQPTEFRKGIHVNGTEIDGQIQGQSSRTAAVFGVLAEILASVGDPTLRHRSRDFTRTGPLKPALLTTLLLYMVGDGNRRGYRHLLDAFWDECASQGLELPTEQPVTAAAFCQARGKLPAELLRRVLHGAAAKAEFRFPGATRWNGRRVFAVDGCKVNLQRSDELNAAFGKPTGGHVPQATVSALVNVITKMPADVVVDRYGVDERQLLVDHLEVLQPGDLLVLDRGYPSHEMIRLLSDSGLDFLVRIPAEQTFDAMADFRASGRDDYRVVIPPASDRRCGAEPIELRAVKLVNSHGEKSFYLTSLRRAHFSRAQIAELYRLRWQAEEFFRLEKSVYFDQRQFHAKSALGVRQEILAQAIYVVIARFLLAEAARYVGARHDDLSIKSSVLALAAYLTRLCLDDPERAVQYLPQLLERIARTRDKRRPRRSCPRRSFKPGPRWSPKGRRGA